MGERIDRLNDYERIPYIPGGYTPQEDHMAEPLYQEHLVSDADPTFSDLASAMGLDASGNTNAEASRESKPVRGNIKEASNKMSETIDKMQGQSSPKNLKMEGNDTVKQTSIQAKDTAAQKLQQVANQVSEKASPVVNQAATQARELGDQAQRQVRMVREKYGELQERTGIRITPQMLGIAAGVVAGVVALIAMLQRRSRTAEIEREEIATEIALNALPKGKYILTRID